MSWVLTILGIVALIILHELGHFAVAKATGMRVERFSLFFPPKLFGVRRGETEYMVGAIPAGGYVKITGMTPEEIEDAEPEIAKQAYCNQAPWKRIVVILAGPAMNLLIAFFIFWAILFVGDLNGVGTLENLNPSIQTRIATTSVHKVLPGQPADGVLRSGDQILAVDGLPVNVQLAERAIAGHRCAGTPAPSCRAQTPVRLTVKRAGHTLTLSVYPRYNTEAKRMQIGFDFGEAPKRFGVLAAAGVALREMWTTTTNLISGIGRAFTSAKSRQQVHTIIGISEVADEAVAAGAGYGLVILAFISLVLAIVNLFPFLPLDGGHVVWALGEKLRGGRRISVNAMWRYSSVGILLFVFLFINGLSNDISRLGG